MSTTVIDESRILELKELDENESSGFLLELIREFSSSAHAQAHEIRTCFEKADGLKLSRAAHALKGASLNMGAQKLAEVCLQLEISGKTGQTAGCLIWVDKLETLLEETLLALKNIAVQESTR